MLVLSLFTLLLVTSASSSSSSSSFCDALISRDGAREYFLSRSVSLVWSDVLLCAIRHDSARPTVHARNLYHHSLAAYNCWREGGSLEEQELALSLCSYRFLRHRFSPTLAVQPDYVRELVDVVLSAALDLSPLVATSNSTNQESTVASQPALREVSSLSLSQLEQASRNATGLAARGLQCAQRVIDAGLIDGSNEAEDYAYPEGFYHEKNFRLNVFNDFNAFLPFPNNWQRLWLGTFVDQASSEAIDYPPFLSPHWLNVTSFALLDEDRSAESGLFFDPGPPPRLGTDQGGGTEAYVSNFTEVIRASTELDPADGVRWDISPASRGHSPLGTNDGRGRLFNPSTREPYARQFRPRGDYTRVLAEFWADGPDSETPPGHWVSMWNRVSEQVERRWRGRGRAARSRAEILRYDLRSHLVLCGALHDAAIVAWATKNHYDYVRPISAIRYLWSQSYSQVADRSSPSFIREALPIVPGLIELILPGTAQYEETSWQQFGIYRAESTVAVRSWAGGRHWSLNAQATLESDIDAPPPEPFGVGWLLGGSWWPYQRPSFVTPPFAGYVSGHSTFSRAAADSIAWITGSHFWPQGMGTFLVPRDDFLVFERGPSEDLHLQWATYRDAADETALSRIWGGIHPPCDDFPGRRMGAAVSQRARERAEALFATEETVSGGSTVVGHRARLRCVLLSDIDDDMFLQQRTAAEAFSEQLQLTLGVSEEDVKVIFASFVRSSDEGGVHSPATVDSDIDTVNGLEIMDPVTGSESLSQAVLTSQQAASLFLLLPNASAANVGYKPLLSSSRIFYGFDLSVFWPAHLSADSALSSARATAAAAAAAEGQEWQVDQLVFEFDGELEYLPDYIRWLCTEGPLASTFSNVTGGTHSSSGACQQWLERHPPTAAPTTAPPTPYPTTPSPTTPSPTSSSPTISPSPSPIETVTVSSLLSQSSPLLSSFSSSSSFSLSSSSPSLSDQSPSSSFGADFLMQPSPAPSQGTALVIVAVVCVAAALGAVVAALWFFFVIRPRRRKKIEKMNELPMESAAQNQTASVVTKDDTTAAVTPAPTRLAPKKSAPTPAPMATPTKDKARRRRKKRSRP